jgi:valyl-tRNA synthetase
MLEQMKLPKIYEPGEYERDIYALWEKSRAFEPKHRDNTASFSMVFPLPNANGNLHLGHALTNALHDILTRYHRMKGEATLYLPGADHAGFETWVVYEKQLAKEGKSRFDFTREELYQQVWNFVTLNRTNLQTQFRALGASCDWSRFTFTLDEKIVRRAYDTFKKMWDENLIYRGERLVNFCTFHGTAFADIEVEYKEEQGHLWFIRYPLVDKSGEIVVATTRPETMLGDVAVAVNPNDKRYKHLVGKTVRLPLTGREIPVIADEFVDEKFGTGAVKITPAHDPNDFEAGKRHNLSMISVISHEGKMIDVPEAYRDLDVKAARTKVVKDLEEQGFLVKAEMHGHSVGHCYKCGTVIQPLLREQWFVDMQPLAKKAVETLEAGKIAFYPAAKKEQLVGYLKELRDWNISRQIAWGIPIPAFQNVDEPDDWLYNERVDKEIIEVNGKTYRRDSDVFDTWFSSSSWPYATLDFPDSQDFKEFYPLSVMETGGEILYPWVSRMIMLGLYVTDEIPFKDVYIHGYVMAEDGAKMSKSLGNVIDPMPVIKQYGSDALRMGIVASRTPAVNRGYDVRKIEDARNFCNKLWNIARYIEDKIGDDFKLRYGSKPETIADHWLLSKLQHSTEAISADLDNYRFAEACDMLYHFVWDDFADWYIEASKVQPNTALLALALETILKLAQPFAPFVTETIWQTLAWEPDSLLITSHWPETFESSTKQSFEANAFEELRDIVEEIRFIKNTLKLQTKPPVHTESASTISQNGALLAHLARSGEVSVGNIDQANSINLGLAEVPAWLEVGAKAKQQFMKQLQVRIQDQESRVAQLEARLKNKDYLNNAPKELVAETKKQLAEAKAQLKQFTADYKHFVALG